MGNSGRLHHARRIDGLGTTVFTEMTALADAHGAINLGQRFPDTDGPTALTPPTRVLRLNTPHNPTGRAFYRAELEWVTHVCTAHALVP